MNKHSTEAFSIKYVGRDVHKETIAVAVAGSDTAEPRVLGIIIPNDTDVFGALAKKLGQPSLLCAFATKRDPAATSFNAFFNASG